MWRADSWRNFPLALTLVSARRRPGFAGFLFCTPWPDFLRDGAFLRPFLEAMLVDMRCLGVLDRWGQREVAGGWLERIMGR